MKPDEEENDELIARRKNLCICESCPTYNECAREKKELLYCTLGKSTCFQEKIGCLCPSCPVHDQMWLKKSYYCERGSEGEQKRI